MAKIRRIDSKAALSQQKAEFRRSAPGSRLHVGDQGGADAARKRKHEEMEHLHEQFAEEHRQEEQRTRDRASLWPLLVGLARDSFHLATAVAAVPFRVARAVLRVPRHA
ncbi:MAG TPA: hypothetical protein VFX49_13840 [Chloroflexota bacterium]|nr:hypothetical protein [Chloroflexota bacterium]